MIHAYGEILIDFLDTGNQSYKQQAGGAPSNVAVMASLLGTKSKMITSLSKDFFGEFLLNTLKNYDVDTSDLVRLDKPTMLAFVQLDKGERQFSFYRNDTADNFLPVLKDLDFEKNIFHFGSVCLNNEHNINAHKQMIQKYKAGGSLISFDPNLRFNLFEDEQRLRHVVLDFLATTDVLKVSEEELYFLTELSDDPEAIKKLFRYQIKYIFVTRGSKGATLYTKNFTISHNGFTVNTVDTTGAGDAFVGVILHHLDQEDPLMDEKTWAKILEKACYIAAETTKYNGSMNAYKEVLK